MTTSEVPGSAAADPDLEAGQIVGEYQVEGKLGQGGFGAVFKAAHPLIGKVVAIKVLSRKFSVDPEMVSRFIAEARAVNQIRHRNIIDIFSFGQLPDGRHYYVMEYLDGEPLDALIDRERMLPLEQALPILRQVARALDAAHAKGIAHRDLKPENIFLARDPDGDGYWAKLLDFGIAKLLAAPEQNKVKTRTGIPIGTPYYMSPEQCRGKDVDHRTDYYAFGIVAYRMLTGAYPIDGDDFMDILMKQISQDPAPASTINGALPSGVDDTIAWLMAKDPAQRPPNLVTAVRALEGAAESAGIAVPRSSAGWDAATPSPMVTPPPRSATGQGARAVTPGMAAASTGKGAAFAQTSAAAPTAHGAALAQTMPSGTLQPVPAKRAMWPLIAGAVGMIVLAGAAFVVLHRGGETPPAPPPAPPPKPAVVTPPPAVVVDAAPAVVIDAAPATVQITIDKAPAGSEIVLGDRVLGKAPGPITLDRGTTAVKLTVRKAGFVGKTIDVVPDGDHTVDAHLDAIKRTPHTTTTHDSHDIEDPFRH
jgi:serine/threonine-protein kinase